MAAIGFHDPKSQIHGEGEISHVHLVAGKTARHLVRVIANLHWHTNRDPRQPEFLGHAK